MTPLYGKDKSIVGRMPNIPIDEERYELAFNAVQATLLSESMFFEAVTQKLTETAPMTDFPTVASPYGLQYLLNFTRFLFFLRALDCTDAEKIGRFIDLHNDKLEMDLADPGFARSVVETKKAVIRKDRKTKIVDTVRAFGRPVFAIYEYGHFLIDSMSPKTTEKLIEDLRFGGLVNRLEDHRIDADQKRVLIESSGFLEEVYVSSLLSMRTEIARTMDADEFQSAKS